MQDSCPATAPHIKGKERVMDKNYLRIEDGTLFPIVDYKNNDELVWRAFNPEFATLSDYDKKRLGGIAQVYMQLINMPLKYSNRKLSMIRKALRQRR
jgi:hypothetical protein